MAGSWWKFLGVRVHGTGSGSGIILLLLIVLTGLTLQAQGQANSTCVSKKTCGECIRSPDCVWCSQPEFKNAANLPLDRCNTPTVHAAHPESIRCESGYLLNPKNEWELTEDLAISKGSEYSQVVQIRPQRVKLALRVGQAYDLHVQYAQAEDYPVDLYYLMDLSKSMEDDKETLSAMGAMLAAKMQELTSDFQLGFGSFVDKVVMPFVSTVEKKILEPCDSCVPPYGYRHHLTLSTNTTKFSGEVQRARVSGNLDAPEGGFDAIMQAVVCDSIGWREEARKLLVFSTDASFHYAGDGKLGGIVKPNDGLCHMDSRGEYTHSTIQDYPSVAQINSKVKEKSINMIFAVTAEQVDIYKLLSLNVEGSSCGELSANSSNVVELVSEEYRKITSSVEMKDTATEGIRVSYFSKCLGNDLIETNKCNGLHVGTLVEFLVKIEVTKCPKNSSDWHQEFVIYQVGLNERVHVELDMLCECECEKFNSQGFERYSPFCNNQGTYKCGICECNEGFFGRNCECNAAYSRIDDDRACRLDNTTDIVCSNRGECVCGLCECKKRDDGQEITGTYCQCDNFSCERENGLLCSGSDHGTCDCGKCQCERGWSGPACDCSTEKKTCTDPSNNKICNDHGSCKCGKCDCENTLTERYSGRFCEKCPNCPDRCEELQDCVQCKVHGTGKLADEDDCISNCTIYPEILQVDVASNDETNDEKFCPATDLTDQCRFYYIYGYDANRELYIRAQRTKDCPPEPPIFLIIFGVVGAIVLVGILFLVIWKLLTHIHDRAEYARFEKERMNAKWDAGENPIYKQATSTFKNPVYSGK